VYEIGLVMILDDGTWGKKFTSMRNFGAWIEKVYEYGI
jgi:hypothetical protein